MMRLKYLLFLFCFDFAQAELSKEEISQNTKIGAGLSAAGALGGAWVLYRSGQGWLMKRAVPAAQLFNRATFQNKTHVGCAEQIRIASHMTVPRSSNHRNFRFGGNDATKGGGLENEERGNYDFSPRFLGQTQQLSAEFAALQARAHTDADTVDLYSRFLKAVHEENIAFFKHYKVRKDLYPNEEWAFSAEQLKILEDNSKHWNNKLRANQNLFFRHIISGRSIMRLVGITAMGLVIMTGDQMMILGFNDEENDIEKVIRELPHITKEGIESLRAAWKTSRDVTLKIYDDFKVSAGITPKPATPETPNEIKEVKGEEKKQEKTEEKKEAPPPSPPKVPKIDPSLLYDPNK